MLMVNPRIKEKERKDQESLVVEISFLQTTHPISTGKRFLTLRFLLPCRHWIVRKKKKKISSNVFPMKKGTIS